MNIFSVEKQYLLLLDALEESGGEITPEIEKMIECSESDRDALISSLLKEIKNVKSDSRELDTVIAEFVERKKKIDAREESIKKNIVKLLVFFDLRSTNKKSTGYAFKNALFSCFTRTTKSCELDDLAIYEKFKPFGGLTSDFIKYSVNKKFSQTEVEKINKTGIVPEDAYMMNIDKKALVDYLVEQSEPKQLEIGAEEVAKKVDPLKEYAKIVTKTSLTVL